MKERLSNSFSKLAEVVATLRGPDGCAWDKKQTLYSIKNDFLDEAYELADAIDRKDIPNIKEELGDIMLHVVMHSQIASEMGLFDVADVLDGISEKLIRRHPHVFGNEQTEDTAQILKRWEEIKKEENKDKPVDNSVLRKAKKSMPTMLKAEKLQKAAATVGFDWEDVNDIINKLEEEVAELRAAIAKQDTANIQEEIGDAIFALTNIAIHCDISSEDALKSANEKFIRRFSYIEEALNRAGRDINTASLDEMETLWQQAKSNELK